MKLRYKRPAACFVAALFFLGSIPMVNASEELESRQDRIDAIEEEQSKVRKRLSELSELKEDVNAYIEAIDEELKEAGESLEELEAQMEDMRADISAAKEELALARVSEQEQYEDMKLRIQYMYEKGDTLFLDMLFQSSSLSEFLNRAEYISRISEYDRNMLAAYVETKELIAGRTEELEEAYAALELMTDRAEAKRLSLSELQEAKEAELSGLNVEISENQDLMTDYDEALKDELEEFLALEEAIRLREEAEAKALAESVEASKKAEQESETTEEETKPPEETSESGEGIIEEGTAGEGTAGDEPEESKAESEPSEDMKEPETTKAPAETPAKPPAASPGFIWPVPSCGRISSGYGSRDDPLTGESDGTLSDHKGIDIALPGGALAGAPIVAAGDGEVIIARSSASAGNWIVLYHGNSTYTVYMHCQKLFVSAGDTVEQGEAIGLVGSTGWSTGAHLHFEVRVGGFSTSVYSKNPLNYVSPP